jgi:hypothetical protein
MPCHHERVVLQRDRITDFFDGITALYGTCVALPCGFGWEWWSGLSIIVRDFGKLIEKVKTYNGHSDWRSTTTLCSGGSKDGEGRHSKKGRDASKHT